MTDTQIKKKESRFFAPELDTWEKQPWESDLWFERFRIFRNMNPQERSIVGVWRHVNGYPDIDAQTARQNASKYYKYYHLNRWRQRVNDFDRYVDTVLEEELIKRRMQARMVSADLGGLMKQKALQAVEKLKVISEIENEDGETVYVVNLSVSDIERLAKTGADIEAQALQDPALQEGARIAVQVNVGDLREKAKKVIDAQEKAEADTKALFEDV